VKTVRLSVAIALLRGAGIVAGVIAGLDLRQSKYKASPAGPVLLASIVGLAVASLWIWISARAR
jgi:hypothetical protein